MSKNNRTKFKPSPLGPIPEDWEVRELKDCSKLIQYGYTQASSSDPIGPKFLRITDIQNNYIDWDSVPYCNISNADYKKYKLEEGDIIIARTGASTGTNAICSKNIPDAVFASYLIRLKTNKYVLPFYIYKFLQSKPYKEYIKGVMGGSAQPNANAQELTGVKVPIPPMIEQHRIAEILSSLDDKIELNRKMNKILESIAQALFKRWFVDFEFPNDEGKPYKSSGGKMVDSELGEIPEGWREVNLGDVLELAYGKALKEGNRELGNIPVYGSNGQVGWHNEMLISGPGVVVGRKGNPGVVTWVQEDFYPIDTTFYIIPKDCCTSLFFIFYMLKLQDLGSLGADSAVPGLNRNLAYMNKVILPSSHILEVFDSQMSFLNQQINKNNKENNTLSSIRDSLLPRLMSGRLRVI